MSRLITLDFDKETMRCAVLRRMRNDESYAAQVDSTNLDARLDEIRNCDIRYIDSPILDFTVHDMWLMTHRRKAPKPYSDLSVDILPQIDEIDETRHGLNRVMTDIVVDPSLADEWSRQYAKYKGLTTKLKIKLDENLQKIK